MKAKTETKDTRDRKKTEQKLIEAVGESIKESGFEFLSINRVALRSGYSKSLIYRYFGSMDWLVFAYMKRNDFWLNSVEAPDLSDLKGYLKGFFRREINRFRSDTALRRLSRWELSTDKDFIVGIRAQREKRGVALLEVIALFSKMENEQIKAISALINAGIIYLAILEENCQMYSGIDIQSEQGWERIAESIDAIIDIIVVK